MTSDSFHVVPTFTGFRFTDNRQQQSVSPFRKPHPAKLEQKAAPYITTALALEWAMQHVDHQPCTWAQRLGFVRVFARHWSATDPRTEIPPAGLLPFRRRRARPYLYTEKEVQCVLVAAKRLSPSSGAISSASFTSSRPERLMSFSSVSPSTNSIA
jgi:hypothetical protein